MLRERFRDPVFSAFFLFCCCSLLLIGCTHTVNVPLKPNYEESLAKENALSSVTPPIALVKGGFADKRADTSKLATFKQQVHTFNLYGERPLEEVIFDGLKELFSNSGHTFNVSGSGDARVDVALLNLSASRNAGMVDVTASSSIQISLRFTNLNANNVIYSEIYNGSDDRGRAMVGTMDMVYESINAAIVDCINSVGEDESLVKALKEIDSAS